ncbi:DUF3795 domain-containing protein [Myxococcota bacterium]|nr:DUF3795 domain-containing protein [Myxococcota bacterium]MBU1382151.1 DUF3795 domain-containing protein [Myxococcota bacterium]MBU1495914.1 DUF3795 domain-containing protein [Myxococcota bacterium]
MQKDQFAYCGLNCARCRANFADIKDKINALNIAFEKVNMKEIVKAIPFMRFKYSGYKKFTTFFSAECPGCRNGGGNPFCSIRKCAHKKSFFTCAECDKLCSKFNTLLKIHDDGEIQTNISGIKQDGLDSYAEKLKV